MDVSSILIVLPLLIIFSYLFDIFARRTKFPSVILLVFTGIIARFISSFYGYDNFAFLDSLVPVLGTIGLILIVLEAAIELEIKIIDVETSIYQPFIKTQSVCHYCVRYDLHQIYFHSPESLRTTFLRAEHPITRSLPEG